MNNYGHVLRLAKSLQEEFGNKITLAESLQVAALIHQTEVIAAGLLVRSVNESEDEPVALEAIAMTLGYTEEPGSYASNGNILDAIRNRSSSKLRV